MTDPEHFLSRWSRKKRDAVDESGPPAVDHAANAPPPEAVADKPLDQPVVGRESEPAFDPASLPSLDSIGAQTDIRAFLQPGVPPELTRAALRRVWSSDPAIRDFKGLQENDWDFNDPNSMFGFGELGPDFDLKRMLASVFGEKPQEAESPAIREDVDRPPSPPSDELLANGPQTQDGVELLPAVDRTAVARAADGQLDDPDSVGAHAVQRNTNVASQDEASNLPTKADKRARSHGGALPRE
jgi:hypothetical protein